MIRALTTLELDPAAWEALSNALAPDAELHRVEASAGLADAEAEILITDDPPVNRAGLPRLRWMQLTTTGIDHLELDRSWEGVTITTASGLFTPSIAEFVSLPAGRRGASRCARADRRSVPADRRVLRARPRTGARRARLALDYYWEVDCGAGRLGTQPGIPSADAIERAAALDGPRYRGLMAFAGHAYGVVDPDARRGVADEEHRALTTTAGELERRGIEPGALSVGSTPLAALESPYATEYRFGNYVFYDATQVALGSATLDDCALSVEATVIGVPAGDRVILDAGSKALAAERMSGATSTFGIVRGYPGLEVAQLYEEHAICLAAPGSELPALGDRVEVVPNHACTCANLHAAYNVRGSRGEHRWAVEARGWERTSSAAPTV